MPSKIRDIADILGITETANPTNAVLTSAADGSGLVAYATLDDLPTTGLTSGDQAFITATNRLYISNGSGWYNVALFNATPTLDISPSGAITLAVDGSTPTVITLTGADSDNADANLTYTVESDGSFANIATLSQDSSVFTITPLAEGSATPGSSTLTFKVSDGINFGSGTTQFSLTFSPDWATASVTESKVTASDAQNYDNFGTCAISGDGAYAIVGAEGEDTAGSSAGAAYIYVRSGSTWTQQARITGSYMAPNGYFGQFVDMNSDGTYAIVGAAGPGDGSAYIFTRSGSTWTQQAKLNPAAGGSYFGSVVSMNSDATYVAISNVSTGAGAVYVFTRSGSTWTEQATLTASPALNPGDSFGTSIMINSDGTYIIAGSGFEDTGKGAAYIFTRSGTSWSQQARIQSTDIQNSDNFGYAGTAINEDATTIAVGATGEDGAGSAEPNSGAMYIFTRSGSTWTQQAKIKESPVVDYAQLGWRVALSNDGNILVVGVWTTSSMTGKALVYNRSGSTWSLIKTLTASDGQTNARFGWKSDMSENGKYIMIAASYDNNVGGDQQGSAYIYEAG